MSLDLQQELDGDKENGSRGWGLVLVLATIGFVLGMTFSFFVISADAETKSLMDEVTDGPRNGVVVESVGDEVCLILLNRAGKADNAKSCVKINRIFNYGLPGFGQPVIAAPLGDIYEVHRVKDFGVSDGLVFYPDHGAPIPIPSPGIDVVPEDK